MSLPPSQMDGLAKDKTRSESSACSLPFQDAVERDHDAVLRPDLSPFTSGVDLVRRLLPYHVWNIPHQDLLRSIGCESDPVYSAIRASKRRKKQPTTRIKPDPDAPDTHTSQLEPETQTEPKLNHLGLPTVLPEIPHPEFPTLSYASRLYQRRHRLLDRYRCLVTKVDTFHQKAPNMCITLEHIERLAYQDDRNEVLEQIERLKQLKAQLVAKEVEKGMAPGTLSNQINLSFAITEEIEREKEKEREAERLKRQQERAIAKAIKQERERQAAKTVTASLFARPLSTYASPTPPVPTSQLSTPLATNPMSLPYTQMQGITHISAPASHSPALLPYAVVNRPIISSSIPYSVPATSAMATSIMHQQKPSIPFSPSSAFTPPLPLSVPVQHTAPLTIPATVSNSTLTTALSHSTTFIPSPSPAIVGPTPFLPPVSTFLQPLSVPLTPTASIPGGPIIYPNAIMPSPTSLPSPAVTPSTPTLGAPSHRGRGRPRKYPPGTTAKKKKLLLEESSSNAMSLAAATPGPSSTANPSIPRPPTVGNMQMSMPIMPGPSPGYSSATMSASLPQPPAMTTQSRMLQQQQQPTNQFTSGGVASSTSTASTTRAIRPPPPLPSPQSQSQSQPQPPPQAASPAPSIPKTPIPLLIPVSALPRLSALGINPVPAPHMKPVIGPSGVPSGLSGLPRPANPNQPEPAVLLGITEAALSSQSPSPSQNSRMQQILHISVVLTKLNPNQLSGLAALMQGLQAEMEAEKRRTTPTLTATSATTTTPRSIPSQPPPPPNG